ncbi:MAG: hypothetical protein A2Y14_00425 [Verrucomicrobia bacterium GWF2_51_19]|nr:MAG: hypothetical protein A2Y14_00425 [Verrucomicrobia bacterium GWF2_51_19]
MTDARRLYDWRRLERVNSCMWTDMTATFEEHCAWIRRKQADATYRFWIAMLDDAPIGLVDLEDLDLQKKTCEWGYYVGEESALGVGGLIPPYVYNHIFFELCLEAVFTEVLDSNVRVMKLHALHGFRYLQRNPKATQKSGAAVDTHSLVLERQTWLQQTALHRFRAHFP